MRRLFNRIPVRLRKFMGVGAFMTMANAMALVLLVDGLSIMPVAANWSRAVVMTQVQFGLHLQFTWADRTGQFWQQWRRYMSLRVVTISLNQALFWTLVAWATLHYMLAYGICTITIGIVNYLTGDRFVFPDKQ